MDNMTKPSRLTYYLVLLVNSVMMSRGGVTMYVKGQYHDNVTLRCDDILPGYTRENVYLKYWVTPRGQVIEWFDRLTYKYIISPWPDFNLTVTDVSNDDFGWYRCVILWDNHNYLHSAMNVGLNVDETDYSELYHVYARSALIGGATAAITVILLVVGCGLYAFCKRKAKPEPDAKTVKDQDRVAERFDRAMFTNAADFIYRNQSGRENCQIDNMLECTREMSDTRSRIYSETSSEVPRSGRADELISGACVTVRIVKGDDGDSLKWCPCCDEHYANLSPP